MEPFGSRYEDERFGRIAAVLANIWRGKNQQPFVWTDFFPEHWTDPGTIPTPASRQEQLGKKILAWAAAQNRAAAAAAAREVGIAPKSQLRRREPRPR